MSDGQRGVAACGGPCGRATPHEKIRPVDRRLQPVRCLICGSVSSIPKDEIEEDQA